MGGLKKYYFGKTKYLDYSEWRFDTIGDAPTDTAFLIRRDSDSVEQLFTYAQITDGTYASFIGASFGWVKSWKSKNNKYSLNQSNAGLEFVMNVNAGLPYLDDQAQGNCLAGICSVKLDNDWIVSWVCHKELNGNNQRCNVAMAGDRIVTGSYNNITMDFTGGNFNFGEDYIQGVVSAPTKSFTMGTQSAFTLYSFSKIGGVFSATKNGVSVTVGSGTGWSIRSYLTAASQVLLGAYINTPTGGTGKINKYQHLGMICDKDLSGFDLTGYLNDIKSRYGIT